MRRYTPRFTLIELIIMITILGIFVYPFISFILYP